MERHSIPQNIMDVEFKLFGAFSVRQFGYLASGFLIATMIYFLNWPFLVKMVLIVFSGGMGLFLALMKINGQPSSVFVLNFIHALFNSQSRVWRKTAVVPDALKETKSLNVDDLDGHIASRAKKRLPPVNTIPLQKLALSSVSAQEQGRHAEADKYEEMRLNQIEKYYDFEIDKINKVKGAPPAVKRAVDLPTLNPKPKQVFTPVISNVEDGLAQNITPDPSPDVLINNEGYKTVFRSVEEVQKGGNVSNKQEVSGDSKIAKLKQEIASLQSEIKDPSKEKIISVQVSEQKKLDGKNLIKGIVVDNTRAPIPQAVISIKSETEQLIRKISADQSGKFLLQNSLPNGNYYVDIMAEGFKFGRYKVILDGEKLYSFQFKSK